MAELLAAVMVDSKDRISVVYSAELLVVVTVVN
jgi:hypothetical protein